MTRVRGRAPRPPRPVATACLEGCGACCDPVALGFTQEQARTKGADFLDPRNRKFILEDLTPIPTREGRARAPYLDWMTMGIVEGKVEMAATVFYNCRHFDAETRSCTNYDNRPPMCSKYPWYDQPPDPTKSIPPTCSYNADVGRTPVPLPTRRAT